MPGDRGWEKLHRKIARQYPGRSAASIDRITAGVKRKQGWKPRVRKIRPR